MKNNRNTKKRYVNCKTMKKRKYSIKRNVLYKIGGECNQSDRLLVKNIEKATLLNLFKLRLNIKVSLVEIK